MLFESLLVGHTDGLQSLSHDLRPVVDGQNNVGNASICQCLDLVLDHRLVRKLNKRLRVCEGLLVSVFKFLS